MSNDIQSALERARMVAAKITGQIPTDVNSAKRPADSSNDSSSKKFASVNDAVGAQLAMLKAQQLGGSNCEEYKVPDKLVGLVIGRGGEQLHRLQADTQCKVQIAPDSNGGPDRTFTLVGSKEAIERAKRSIDEILKRGSSLGSDPNNTGTSVVLQRNNIEIIEIKVPGNKCGLVIGKGGETIKRLSEQYGVKLVVVQESSAASSGDKPLRITGEPEKVAAAKEAVLQMLDPKDGPYQQQQQQHRSDYGSRHHGGAQGVTEAFIKVPGDKAGIVIGKGGESIKDINRRSGAHVEIDKSQRGPNATDGVDKMFIIKGTNEQIQYAQQLIYEKITGIQGSQPPHGYFNNPNEMSPMHNAYGSQRTGTPGYGGAQQQQWVMGYGGQQAQAQDSNAAWAAYYQQYYGGAQPAQQAVAGAAAGAATGASATATSSTVQPTINPQTGQADYSQAWVEYYRSLGMYEQADLILKQTAAATAATGSSSSGATPAEQTNGTNSSGQASASSTAGSQQQQSSQKQQNGTTNGSATAGQYGAQTNGGAQSWQGYATAAGYGQAAYAGYYKQEGSAGQ